MLCIIHGYALSGSGSNLWTRSITRALCQNGETIHLVCQDRRPEQYDFIAAAYTYDGAERETLFERDVPYDGKCILHRPVLELLPVYVRPPSDVTSMVAIPDLSDERIEEYLNRNETALLQIVTENDISAIHVNHVVLMSVVVERVSRKTGIPYIVMPHGSALEYVVKQDPRMLKPATEALNAASKIFFLSDELRERIRSTLPGVRHIEEKTIKTNVGVDSSEFRLVSKSQRPESITRLKETIEGTERGKNGAMTGQLFEALHDDISRESLQDLLRTTSDYLKQRPDADLEEKIDQVDWENEDILAFVGKLIGYKGLPALIAAFPLILAERPRTRLVIVGRGPLREVMEAFVWALAYHKTRLARNIVAWGGQLEGESDEPFTRVERFFGKLEEKGMLDEYFETAARLLDPRRVVFTGHLEHNALSHLYPCCDVAVFPSVVAEAGPLVLIEAMASGCFPTGTYFAGMGANIDIASAALPSDKARYMRLRRDPEYAVEDIIRNTIHALELGGTYRKALREIAVEQYDWARIATRLAGALHSLAGSRPAESTVNRGR